MVEVPKKDEPPGGTGPLRLARNDTGDGITPDPNTDDTTGSPKKGSGTQDPNSGDGPPTGPVVHSTDPTTSAPVKGSPAGHEPGAGSPYVSAPVKDPVLPGGVKPEEKPPYKPPFTPVVDGKKRDHEQPYPYREKDFRNKNKDDKDKDKDDKNKNPGNKKAGSKTPPQPPQIPPFQLPPPPPPTEIPEFAEVQLPQPVPFPPYLPLLELLRRDTDQTLGIFGTFFAAMQQNTPELTSSENFLAQMGAIARQGQTYREQVLASFNASLGFAARSAPREPSSTFSAGTGAPPFIPGLNFQVPPAFPEGIPRTQGLGIGVPHRSSGQRPSQQTH